MGEDGNRLPIERLEQRIINPNFTSLPPRSTGVTLA